MLSDHLTRISGTRPIKSMTKKEKQDRETSWNPRFYIERMPEYNAARDRYLQNLVATIKTKKIQVPITKVRKVRIRSPKHIMKSNSTKRLQPAKPQVMRLQLITKLKSSIQSAYVEKNIPVELSKGFFQSLESLDPKIMMNYMSKTLSELYSDKNSVQYAIKAVKAREEWIEQIKEMLNSQLIAESEYAEIIDNLRMLSIHAVECIDNWSHERIDSTTNKNPRVFMWNEENYLIQMSKDLEFLKDSVFAKVLGEDVFKTWIPNFVGRPKKLIAKRFVECEAKIAEATHHSVRETPFEMRKRKHTASTEKVPDNLVLEVHQKNEIKEEEYFIEGCVGNISLLLEEYAKLVPEAIKNCLGDPLHAYTHALTMKFPAILWIKSSHNVIGLFTLNIDNQKTTQSRLFLSHISCKHVENLEKVVNMAVHYASTNYPCDEIRVALSSPANSEGKYESDKSIKQFFDKLGFRWKILLKDENSHPIQLLGLACKKSTQNSPNQDIFSESINLYYSCSRQYASVKQTSDSFINAIGVAAFLKRSEGVKHVTHSLLQNIIEKSASNWNPPAFKIQEMPSDQEDISLDKEKTKTSLEKNNVTALFSVGLNWVRFLTTPFLGYRYSFIHTNINVMKSGTNKVYVIPTEDCYFSVFVIPCDRNNEDNFERAHHILGNITTHEEVLEEIWIPEFHLTDINNCEVKSGEEEENIICKESVEIKIRAALHTQGNAVIEPKSESVVVKTGFLFGLMHSKIDEDYEVPYITTYVRVEDFSLA